MERKESGEEEKEGVEWAALYGGLQSDLYVTIIAKCVPFSLLTFYCERLLTLKFPLLLLLSIPPVALHTRPECFHNAPSPTLYPNPQPSHITLLLCPQRSPKATSPQCKKASFSVSSCVASRAVFTPLNIIPLRLQEERADFEDDDSSSASLTPGGSECDSDGRLTPLPASNPPRESVGLYTGVEATQKLTAWKNKEDMGILSVARLIYAERGLKGFWKGFTTSALLSINPSITLAVFQVLRKAIIYSRRRHNPLNKDANLTPMQTFFVGAIANSIASTILYPLILAKKRLQSSSPQSRATLVSALRESYLDVYDPHAPSASPAAPFPDPSLSITTPGATTEHPLTLSTRPSYKRARRNRRAREVQGKMEGLEGLY